MVQPQFCTPAGDRNKSAPEKSASVYAYKRMRKKRTRINPHQEKNAHLQENTTQKIILISLLNSEQRYSFVHYFTLFILRQSLFLSLCSL